MSDRQEQLAALDELLRWYLAAISPLGRPENNIVFDTPEIPTDHPACEELKSEAAEIFSRLLAKTVNGMNGIEAAKRRLLASGYPVPEHWLTVESIEEPNCPHKWRRDPESSKTLVRFQVVVKEADREQLERICDEIYAAKLRVEYAPVDSTEPTSPQTLADARTVDKKTDNSKKSRKNPVPYNVEVSKLAKYIKRQWKQRPSESKTSLAVEFTDGNTVKADSLLRQLRRFPELLD